MKHYVQVPIDRALRFPGSCPFSGKPSAEANVHLKRTSTSMMLPLPTGDVLNRYKTTAITFPANRSTALMARALGFLVWASLLGGMGVCALFLATDSGSTSLCGLAIILGILFSAIFRFVRFLVLRKVQIKNEWNGFVEVRFHLEQYAKEFSEINRLALDSR